MWLAFMTAITPDGGSKRAVRFDVACNQTGSAENKITERRSLYNNLLTFVGEKGASIKTVTSSNNDPPVNQNWRPLNLPMWMLWSTWTTKYWRGNEGENKDIFN